MLPLDLHVLGLPLAFILSQDQTLRCNLDLDLIFRIDFFKFPGINRVLRTSLFFATNIFKELFVSYLALRLDLFFFSLALPFV